MLTKIFQFIKGKLPLPIILRGHKRPKSLPGRALFKRFFAITQNDEKKQITPLFFKEGLGEISFLFKKLPLLLTPALLLSLLLPESVAFAAPGSGVTDTMKEFTEVIVLVLHFVVYLSWLVIGLMGDLLSNDLVMHPNVLPLLQLLWVIVRNLVNMTFVIVLLYIAFKTIFNVGNDGMSEIKEKLGPMIIAIVVVNFSFLGMKVLVDASSVATNAAFSLANIFPKGSYFQEKCGAGTDGCPMQEIYAIHYKYKAKDPNDIKKDDKGCHVLTGVINSSTDKPERKEVPCQNPSKLKLHQMVFSVPYDSGIISGGIMNTEKAFGRNATPENITKTAKLNFIKQFQNPNGSY
ncbi:hypothetical protein HON22_03565, partial [Candidatus Peregrinibacteria bacterium]|nr:hypothetical protein [Candidatus Peregrinibacteria bacterium]